MNRKQRRALNKKMNKGKTKELSDSITSFGSLGDECLVCQKPFDKKDKSMVMTWNVVVRASDDVRLYCPDCWTTATKIVKDYYKENKDAST